MISIPRGLVCTTAVVGGLLFAAVDPAAQESSASLGARLSASVGSSDNVTLAPTGSEQSERIADVTAGIAFSRTQTRLDTNLAYQIQGLFYDEAQDADEVFHQLNASGRLALVLNHLFVDFLGVYDQTITDATGKYSVNNIALTGDRTDVAIVGLSPNLALFIGDNATGELRFGKTRLDYHDPELVDSAEEAFHYRLDNHQRLSGVAWGTDYSQEKYEYEAQGAVEFETFESDLGFWIGPHRVFTIQGLETDYTQLGAFGESAKGGLDEHFWYFGTEWRPNERTSLEWSVGERFFGDTARFLWQRQTRGGGALSVSYAEEPNTFLREQLNSIRRVGELAPIDSLDGPTGNRLYLQKRFDAGYLLNRNKSTLGLRLFSERRFDIFDAILEIADTETEEYRGFELSWGWEIDSRSTLGASMQKARRFSTLNVVDDRLEYVTIDWRRRVGRTSELTVTASQQSSDPQSDLGNALQYKENQLTVSFSRTYGANQGTRVPQRYSDYANAGAGAL